MELEYLLEIKKHILDLHSEMKALTLQAGVEEEFYNQYVSEVDEYTEEELISCLKFLESIRIRQFRTVKEVWLLLPKDIWERYQLREEHDLKEMKYLKQAYKELRAVWKKPYRTEKQLQRKKSRHNPIKHKL